MNLLKIFYVSFLTGILAMSQWACSPKLTEGAISYEISPGILKSGGGASPLEKKVYFASDRVVEPPINSMDTPPFHLFRQYDKEKNEAFDHREFLGTYYQVKREKEEPLVFIPLKGKKRILGYPCRKAQIQTESDTAIVWFTTKLPVSHAPFFSSFDRGFVLELQEKYMQPDEKALDSLSQAKRASMGVGADFKGAIILDSWPLKEVIRTTKALSLSPQSPLDSLLHSDPSFLLVDEKEYQRRTRNFTPVTANQKP